MATDYSRDALLAGSGELAPIRKAIHEKMPAIWASFADVIFMNLHHGDVETRVTETLGVVDALRKSFGGQQPYLPLGVELDFVIKFRRAYDRFDGLNINELAKEEGVPARVLYRHFKEIRAEEVEKRKKKRGE